MVAAPKNGSLTFKGLNTGKVYTVDAYISDVAAAYVTFNPAGKAGTGNTLFWKAPEDVVLVDFSVATGLTDTVGMQALADDVPIAGGTLRYANFINTLANRAAIQLGWRQGRNIAFTQFS